MYPFIENISQNAACQNIMSLLCIPFIIVMCSYLIKLKFCRRMDFITLIKFKDIISIKEKYYNDVKCITPIQIIFFILSISLYCFLLTKTPNLYLSTIITTIMLSYYTGLKFYNHYGFNDVPTMRLGQSTLVKFHYSMIVSLSIMIITYIVYLGDFKGVYNGILAMLEISAFGTLFFRYTYVSDTNTPFSHTHSRFYKNDYLVAWNEENIDFRTLYNNLKGYAVIKSSLFILLIPVIFVILSIVYSCFDLIIAITILSLSTSLSVLFYNMSLLLCIPLEVFATPAHIVDEKLLSRYPLEFHKPILYCKIQHLSDTSKSNLHAHRNEQPYEVLMKDVSTFDIRCDITGYTEDR